MVGRRLTKAAFSRVWQLTHHQWCSCSLTVPNGVGVRNVWPSTNPSAVGVKEFLIKLMKALDIYKCDDYSEKCMYYAYYLSQSQDSKLMWSEFWAPKTTVAVFPRSLPSPTQLGEIFVRYLCVRYLQLHHWHQSELNQLIHGQVKQTLPICKQETRGAPSHYRDKTTATIQYLEETTLQVVLNHRRHHHLQTRE